MPFFIARETPMKRTVTVDHTVFATPAEAEEAARARYPGEDFFIVEAEHAKRAALRASVIADTRRPNLVVADQIWDEGKGR